MLEKPTFDREVNAYLLEVDGVLKSRGLMSMKGTSALDEVQKEVELTLSKMREAQAAGKASMASLRTMANDSSRRVTVYADRIRFNQTSGLSGINDTSDDLLSDPEWKAAFTQVAARVSDFTNRYSRLISNMEPVSRGNVDKALAAIIDNATTSYKQSPTSEAAKSYVQLSMRQLAALDQQLASQLTQSSAAELTVLVRQKDQERVRILSNAKLVEGQASAAQMSVINDANRRAMETLEEILGNQSSYDAGIRQKKFRLVDGDLDMMRKAVESIRFGGKLGQTRYSDNSLRGLSSPRFRDASADSLGGGAFRFTKVDLNTASQKDISHAARKNLSYLRLARHLSPEEKLELSRQINALTPEAFGGRQLQLDKFRKYASSLLEESDKKYGSELGGFLTYDTPQKAWPNWARLGMSLAVYPTMALALGYGAKLYLEERGNRGEYVKGTYKKRERGKVDTVLFATAAGATAWAVITKTDKSFLEEVDTTKLLLTSAVTAAPALVVWGLFSGRLAKSFDYLNDNLKAKHFWLTLGALAAVGTTGGAHWLVNRKQ